MSDDQGLIIGRLMGRVESLEKDVAEIKSDTKAQNEKLDQILGQVNRVRGGLRTLVSVGTVAATIGGFITEIFHFFRGH